MAQYLLTQRQKNMMYEISRGLEDGTIKAEWLYILGNDEFVRIAESDKTGQLWVVRTSNINIKKSDFDDFIDAGLFKYEEKNKYTLETQKIINAVKSNFGENEHVHLKGMVNSIVFTPIFGVPAITSQYKADIFVMMPFKAELKRIYDDDIKPAAQSLNLTINRGDDFFTKHTIMTDVWSAICHCRLIIADCTGKNANVFYELGLAHTVGKPVLLIAQSKDDIPFDVQGHRHIIYDDTSEGLAKLTDELKTAITKVLNS